MLKVAKILNGFFYSDTDNIAFNLYDCNGFIPKMVGYNSIRSWYNTYEEMTYGKEKKK